MAAKGCYSEVEKNESKIYWTAVIGAYEEGENPIKSGQRVLSSISLMGKAKNHRKSGQKVLFLMRLKEKFIKSYKQRR